MTHTPPGLKLNAHRPPPTIRSFGWGPGPLLFSLIYWYGRACRSSAPIRSTSFFDFSILLFAMMAYNTNTLGPAARPIRRADSPSLFAYSNDKLRQQPGVNSQTKGTENTSLLLLLCGWTGRMGWDGMGWNGMEWDGPRCCVPRASIFSLLSRLYVPSPSIEKRKRKIEKRVEYIQST